MSESVSASRSEGRLKWFALVATCFGILMALLDVTVVNVALPVLQKDLNASFPDLQWVIDAYTITLAVFLVTAGRLGDVFGRKRLFIAGLGIFTTGSLLCALSANFTIGGFSNIQILWGARIIQGLGGSIMLPVSLSIISATFQGRQRGTAIGIWGATTGLATAIGPVVGGLLVEKVSWQSIFYLNVPIGVVGILLSIWAIRETRDEDAPRAVDLFGLATITVGLFCLVLGLIQGESKGWGSAYIIILFAVAAASLMLFVVGELRIKNPMLDPRLFKNRSFTGAAIVAFSLSAGLYSLLFFLTLYLQNSLAFDPLQTGLRLLPLSAVVLFIAPLSGNLTGRIGPRAIMFTGMALLTVAVLLMTRISGNYQQSDWVLLLPAFFMAGLGNGLVNPPISTVAVGTVSPARAGMASGVNTVARQVGVAFGIAFWGALLATRYNKYVHDKVQALNSPGLSGSLKSKIIDGVQSAGTTAGSTGLKGGGGQAGSFQNSPVYGTVQQIARASFVDGTVDVLKLAAILLAVGALAALFLIRSSDLVGNSEQSVAEESGKRESLDPLLGGIALAYMSERLETANGESPRLVSAAANLIPEQEGSDYDSDGERARLAGQRILRPLAIRLLLDGMGKNKENTNGHAERGPETPG